MVEEYPTNETISAVLPWVRPQRWDQSSNSINGLNRSAVLVFSLALVAILCYGWIVFISMAKKKKKMKLLTLPPGPRGLPLVGNLSFLFPNLHYRFAKYAKTYGPIMKLRLGTRLLIVVSSPAIAKEVYNDNDIIFSNHDQPIAARVISYGGSNLVRSPYGPTWRMLRRVFLHELLNNKNLDESSKLRQREVGRMVHKLYSNSGTPVNVGEQAFTTFLNLLTSMLWGSTGRLEWDQGYGAGYRQTVIETVELMGRPNISDFLPVLAWFDLQGIERKIKKRVSRLDRMYDAIIAERVRSGGAGEEGNSEKGNRYSKDFLSILLKIIKEADGSSKTPFTMTNLKGLIMDIVLGGTGVTSITVEWVMSELMHRPEIKCKVHEELDAVVGPDCMVQESHIPKLSYLRAVVKETLRLRPTVPLLVPRMPSQPCVVGGYLIPKEARVITNVWAIHMDPGVWNDPTEFRPERFLARRPPHEEFCFFPFGSGRRRCAGVPLVERMLPLVVATLLHAFEWRVPEGMELDLSERSGVTLIKEKPVLVIPTPRFSIPDLYGCRFDQADGYES